MKTRILVLTFFLCHVIGGIGQFVDDNYKHLFTPPLSYVVSYTKQPPVIDGDILDSVWEGASWTEYFQDIEGDQKPMPYYRTRAKMLWDDHYLYIAAELEDKHVWGKLNQHDQVVFYDNDFEVFIDPYNTTHGYFEYEINALNTIFDLFLPKPYRTGSGALTSWNSEGLKHSVKILGTLNDTKDIDKGWTVELAIPFKDITIGNEPRIPRDGDIWRLNFSRVQWETEISEGKYVKKKDNFGKILPENNWVWSPQGVINMHLPERWGYIQFSKNEVGLKQPHFMMPYVEKQKQYLWQIYYRQHEYRKNNQCYAKALSDLGIEQIFAIDGIRYEIVLESTTSQFTATIIDDHNRKVSINDEGYINQ